MGGGSGCECHEPTVEAAFLKLNLKAFLDVGPAQYLLPDRSSITDDLNTLVVEQAAIIGEPQQRLAVPGLDVTTILLSLPRALTAVMINVFNRIEIDFTTIILAQRCSASINGSGPSSVEVITGETPVVNSVVERSSALHITQHWFSNWKRFFGCATR